MSEPLYCNDCGCEILNRETDIGILYQRMSNTYPVQNREQVRRCFCLCKTCKEERNIVYLTNLRENEEIEYNFACMAEKSI